MAPPSLNTGAVRIRKPSHRAWFSCLNSSLPDIGAPACCGVTVPSLPRSVSHGPEVRRRLKSGVVDKSLLTNAAAIDSSANWDGCHRAADLHTQSCWASWSVFARLGLCWA